MLCPSSCGDGDSSSNSSGITPQRQLPLALQLHILSLLTPNERALSGRLLCRDMCNALNEQDSCTASLSQPLPPHVVAWAPAAAQHHLQQLPFQHKLRLLCTAAASGCEANLELALAWLRPSIFPEVLHRAYTGRRGHCAPPDPGEAAVKAGHLQVLGWLLRHCPGLVRPHGVLVAAAKHCDLAGLQAAWKALESVDLALGHGILDAAVGPAAVEKVEWVLSHSNRRCSLAPGTAVAAVHSGDLGRLRWLRDRGCPVGCMAALKCALEHAELAVAQWLVDEAGCKLPGAGSDSKSWIFLAQKAARGPDGVAKLQ